MTKIKHVTIVGGTHGNELTGIHLLKQWQQQPECVDRKTFATQLLFGNPQSHQHNKRYIDEDLNRQFSCLGLAQSEPTNIEQHRAFWINQTIGPKGHAKTDLIIDLHNTTSNMGPSLILLQSDPFNCALGAYVLVNMPEAVVVFEDHIPLAQQPFLCSIAPQGVIVEIGPQPQSVLRQDIIDWMADMTSHILDFVELWNSDNLPALPTQYNAYEYCDTLTLPLDESGQPRGVVHPNIEGNDFVALQPGDPLFQLFSGDIECYQGKEIVYPHFINEAAYYDNHLAMSLARKRTVTVDFESKE